MTKHNNIEKEINRVLANARVNLQGYREKIQLAFEIFISHYETDLNRNSKPFYNIVKSLAQRDKMQFIDYVKQATNIKGLQFTKEGCKLTFDGDKLTFYYSFIDSKKWFDKDKKTEEKAFIYNDDNFIKAIKALISKLKKEGCSVSNNLEKASTLEKLIK